MPSRSRGCAPLTGAGGRVFGARRAGAPRRRHLLVVAVELSAATELQRSVVDEREAGERKRAEHQPEVPQRDVVEAGVCEKVDDDPGQPTGDDVGAVAWLEGNDDAGEDLGYADEVHELLACPGHDVVDPWSEVAGPVDH